MGRPHAKRAKPIMQQGPSTAQKLIAKKRGTRQLREKPRSVDDVSRTNKKDNLNHSGQRSRATVKRLLMYREKAPEVRVRPESAMRQAKVAPNRRWFGNTRVIGQNELAHFREELQNKINDPYTVLLKGKKLPMSLLTDSAKVKSVKMLDVEPFEETFSKGRKRKRPKLASADLSEMLAKADEAKEGYDENKDSNIEELHEYSEAARENIFMKGQSKRIWAELHKVIDSSDVIVQVLDVRDPMGTRCKYVETLLKGANKRHKHLVLLLNKCDLVPTWVTARWIKLLSAEYPTLAFHASINNPFGKGALIQLLRQFGVLHSDKKQISVGFFGYPNVGKSSVINTLRKKRVCKAAPMPGETKVWQYVTLFRGIYLIDCPGTVYGTKDDDMTTVMKGVVRVENIDMPSQYVPGVLAKVKKQYVARHYGLADWKDAEDFLEKLSRKFGKLLKGNEPDVETTSKMVLNDLIRGKLPWFEEPPSAPEQGFSYQKKDLRPQEVKDKEEQLKEASRPSELQEAKMAKEKAKGKKEEVLQEEEEKAAEVEEEEEAEEDDEDEEEEEEEAGRVMPVKQRLSKILCSHRYDHDDMTRGDADLPEDSDSAVDSDDLSEREEEEDGEEEDGAGGSVKGEEDEDEDEDGSGSEISLNDCEDSEQDSEVDEDAAAEAAWAEMELHAENEEEGAAPLPLKAQGVDKKKINRTLLRRRRKAAQKAEGKDKSWAGKISSKPKRHAHLSQMLDKNIDPEDCPAYGKRPKPGRHVNKKRKVGKHFYDEVDVKGKRKKKGRD